TLAVDADGSGYLNLSSVAVKGAFILDIVAHNNDRDRYEFQISPGDGAGAMGLAQRAHLANERWNREVEAWNKAPERKAPGPSKRMESGAVPPPEVAHPRLMGE